jgi:hypothetical protein
MPINATRQMTAAGEEGKMHVPAARDFSRVESMNLKTFARVLPPIFRSNPLVWLLIACAAAAAWIWLGFSQGSKNPGTAQAAPGNVVALQPLLVSHVPAGPDDLTAPGSSAGAMARLDEDYYDFGRIPNGQPVERDFYLSNTGDGDLLVQRAYTTCSCTTAEVSSARVPPGTAARVTIRFDPSLHNVAGTTVRRGLILETNDPQQPVLEIWVQASVRGE